MKQEKLAGTVIPRFTYDTPTHPQADFYALCGDDRPLVMVFLPNYGHPISRVYLTRYCETLGSLRSARLACVVRSDPAKIAQNLEEDYPFTLICDAQGVLYEHFHVQQTTNPFVWSVASARIFREARRLGYSAEKGTAQQLPLTLVVGREGKVLFDHYGQSLTDMPEDCAAMEKVCAHLLAAGGPLPPAPDGGEKGVPAQAPADCTGNEDVLFPGRPLPVEKPEQPQADDHTQPIDLGAWTGAASAAPDEAEDDDLSTPLTPETDRENNAKWNKLLDMFAAGRAGDENEK